MWLFTPSGLTLVFAVLGITLYCMERVQRGEEIDIVDGIKFAVLAGAVAFGSSWLSGEGVPAAASAVELVEEVFTGTPNF